MDGFQRLNCKSVIPIPYVNLNLISCSLGNTAFSDKTQNAALVMSGYIKPSRDKQGFAIFQDLIERVTIDKLSDSTSNP